MFNKSFGTPFGGGTGGFGTSSTFGQQNTGFGTTGGFGTSAFGTTTTTGGLFGSTQNKPGGLFGSPATSSTSTGFGFGATSGTSTSLFGGTSTGTSGGLFSQPNNAFSTNKPTTFGKNQGWGTLRAMMEPTQWAILSTPERARVWRAWLHFLWKMLRIYFYSLCGGRFGADWFVR